jgi:hypothetical protein
MANLADQCHAWRLRGNDGGSGAWVANLAVGFNFQFGHSGGSGASFGGCLAKVAVHPHVFIFFGQNGCSVPPYYGVLSIKTQSKSKQIQHTQKSN